MCKGFIKDTVLELDHEMFDIKTGLRYDTLDLLRVIKVQNCCRYEMGGENIKTFGWTLESTWTSAWNWRSGRHNMNICHNYEVIPGLGCEGHRAKFWMRQSRRDQVSCNFWCRLECQWRWRDYEMRPSLGALCPQEMDGKQMEGGRAGENRCRWKYSGCDNGDNS